MTPEQVFGKLNKDIKGLTSGVASASVSGSSIIFTMNDGSTQTITFPQPKDGASIVAVSTNENNQFVFSMSDGTEIVGGEVPTSSGVSKEYVDSELSKKANNSDIPTKVSGLQNDSNYQTDTDVATALTPYAKSADVTKEITNKVAEIIADAPEDFNTLKEMSDWISNHENDASAMNSAISDNKTAITALQTGKADKSEIPTELPANGGNADTVNNHTVETNVPADSVFTDTIYDDTEVKGSIAELSSNLDGLEYSEVAGGKNLWRFGDIKVSGNVATEVLISDIFKSNTQYTIKLKTKSFTTSDIGHFEFIYTDGTKTIISWDKTIGGAYATTSDYGKTIDILQWTGWNVAEYAEFTEIQLEEGTTATPYEPYIPSVKMLADEVSEQNESLEDYGLNNKFDGQWKVGYYTSTGEYMTDGHITTSNPISVIGGANISVKYPDADNMTIAYFNGSTFISRSLNKYDDVAPTNSTLCYVTIQKQVNNIFISPSTADKLSVYVDNAIDGLKNDLVPKRIELQNVDERVTIQDNGSFIINGFAFVNLLVTFKETLPQWSNFVRLPRPKNGTMSVYCENSVEFTIYSQDNLPGDCGTYDEVSSGTEVRLLVNYEVA